MRICAINFLLVFQAIAGLALAWGCTTKARDFGSGGAGDGGMTSSSAGGGGDASPPPCGAMGQPCCEGTMCNASLTCVVGVCAACPAGQTLCNGSCVELQTDNMNCGGCGLACAACDAGECFVTLASGLTNVYGLTINAIKAYVTTDKPGGAIYAMSLSGGGATNLTPNYPQNSPADIVVDNTYVYWTNFDGGTVMRMPLGGQVAPTTVASSQAYPLSMAIDSANLYWTNFNSPGTVMKASLANLALSTLVSGINSPAGIAVDGTYAYVALESDDYVIKVQLSNGSIVAQLTGFQNNPYALAIDSNNVYFTNDAASGDVRQVPKTASMGAGTILGTVGTPEGIATDGVNVYFTGGNAIYRCPVGVANGCKAVALNQNGASKVVVDGTSVYWTNRTAGTVMKMTPK